MRCAIDLNNLFPIIVILLIVFVSLLKAIFKALSAAKKQPASRDRPSVWGEFKKALQTMAEEQREGGRRRQELEEEGGDVSVEEHPQEPPEERREVSEQVIIVTPGRRSRQGMPEQIVPVGRPVPQAVPAPTPAHRPEDLGAGISREVSDIIHPPVEEHLRERGMFTQASRAFRPGGVEAMVHLAGASPAELRRAILMQEILSAPLAERLPGPTWVG